MAIDFFAKISYNILSFSSIMKGRKKSNISDMFESLRNIGKKFRPMDQEGANKTAQFDKLSASMAEIFGQMGGDVGKAMEKVHETTNNQEAYTVAEHDGVRLLLVEIQPLKNQDGVATAGRKEIFLLSTKNEETGTWEIAGTRTIIIDEDLKNVHLEHITVYSGEQSPEISSGNFQSRGVGVGSVMALVEYLNEPMKRGEIAEADTSAHSMQGWTASVDALNREFNKKFKAVFNASEPDSWDRMEGKVPTVAEAEQRLEAYYEQRGQHLQTRDTLGDNRQDNSDQQQQPPAQAA